MLGCLFFFIIGTLPPLTIGYFFWLSKMFYSYFHNDFYLHGVF